MRWKKNLLVIVSVLVAEAASADSDYNILQTDGSFDFRYDTPDSFHESHANRNNVVKGVFGGRNPGTGAVDSVEYTAGPRGFRPRGKNVARKYDFGQTRAGPVGNKDDPYFDPYEDPSYNFQFNTRSYVRKEGANRLGDVKGSYSFIDDVGERHDVEYIAGKNTGFHVKTPHPDSNPNAYRTTYFRDPRKPYMRGRSFVQRGLDGSYRFAAVGPDQRRTETSDAVGNVRGSYTYRDEKGVQHSVHYIAGPNIGYRVLKNVKGPHLPTFYPFNSPDIVPPDFYEKNEELFTEAESSYVTPSPNKDDYYPDNTNQVDVNQSTKRPSDEAPDFGVDRDEELFDDFFSNGKPAKPGRPSTARPRPTTSRPTTVRPITSRPGFGVTSGFGSTTPRPGLGISITTGRPMVETAVFPGGSTTVRPGITTGRPAFTTGAPDLTTMTSGTGRPSRPTSIRPTIGRRPPLRPTTSRPSSRPRPTIDFGLALDGADDDDIFGAPNKPRPSPPASRFPPTISTPPSSSFPRFPASTLPTSPQDEKPVLQFDLAEVEKGKFHTLVTNLGDTLFTVPPGVSVRAHVQNIDLIPLYAARSPSPSEQYNAEDDDDDEQDDAETSNAPLGVVKTTRKGFSATTPIPATMTTTPTLKRPTTLRTEKDDNDDDDIDIF